MLYNIFHVLSFLFISALILGFLRKDAEDLFVTLKNFFKNLPEPTEAPAASEAKPKA